MACGIGTNGSLLSSVELFKLGAQAWVLIYLPDLTPRTIPVFCQLDSEQLVVLGGDVGFGLWGNSGAILNSKSGAVVRQIDPACEIKFYCRSQSYMQEPGLVLSLVLTKRLEVHLIHYNQATISISTFSNFGRLF